MIILSLKWIIFTRFGINHYKWYQSQFSFLIRDLFGHVRSNPIWHNEDVVFVLWILVIYKYKFLSTLETSFKARESFGLKLDNIYIIECKLLQMALESILNHGVKVCLTSWKVFVGLGSQSHEIQWIRCIFITLYKYNLFLILCMYFIGPHKSFFEFKMKNI